MDISSFVKSHWLPLSLAMFGLTCLLYGLISFSGQKQPQSEVVFDSANAEQGQTSQKDAPSASDKQITVDVEGAVQKPGVYHMSSDNRVNDALLKAGGMSVHADRVQAAKRVNLAGKLTDGMKIYIPFQGESQAATTEVGSVLGESNELVNINNAGQSELEGLPGIGEVTAEKIMGGRPYTTIEELVSKKVLTQKVFEQIKAQITAF